MLKKTYGLVYRRGKWHVKNYGRVLKKGGYSFLPAKYLAWNRNRTGETPIIELKKIVPRPGPKEDYEATAMGPALEPGDLIAFRDVSPFVKVSWKEPGPGQVCHDEAHNRT